MKTAIRKIPLLVFVLVFAFALVAARGADAQLHARVTVILKDVDGKPLVGAKVTVTTPELTKFHEEGKTNKRGEVTIGFADSTKSYVFHIEAEGYPPIDVPMNPESRKTIVREITLLKGGGAAAPEGASPTTGGATVRYTPVEQAYNSGVEAARAQDWAGAEKHLVDALALDAEYSSAMYLLAGIYVQQSRFADALPHAEKYATLAPSEPQGQRLLYEIHQGLGHTQEADAALSRLASLDTSGDAGVMFYNEAVSALKANNPARAESLLGKALELRPDLVPALSALGIAQMGLKKYPEAAATAERLLAVQPTDAKALRLRYDAYKGAGDTAKAAEALTALAAADPKSVAKGFYDEGVKHFEHGEMSQARNALEKAVELDPEIARAHYYLGMAYVNLEQTAKARKALERFVALAPNDPEAPVARDMIGYLK